MMGSHEIFHGSKPPTRYRFIWFYMDLSSSYGLGMVWINHQTPTRPGFINPIVGGPTIGVCPGNSDQYFHGLIDIWLADHPARKKATPFWFCLKLQGKLEKTPKSSGFSLHLCK